ncbi:SDR family NAD(P)-dependent oxidoreductase [Candidatus Woesearchaeota archaeon]|nr:SDR family NAD(P)-dependent oxidoreductase [Candidatus Woesearchaeota archaeon]
MDWSNKNVFITGADGFIGGWIAKVLVERGANVVVLARDDKKESALKLHHIEHKVNIVHGDITDFSLLRRIINEYEIEYCFHLAAQALVQIANRSPLSTFETNIKGTWTLLEAVREVASPRFKALIVASTDKAYGIHEELPYTEESELRGIYPYDASKVCADVLARCYHKMYNLPICVTRKANIYGGADINFGRIVPDTFKSIITGQELIIRSDGTPQRDYMYVEDAADAYITLAENMHRPEIVGQAFNFSSEKPVSVLELVNTIVKVAGKQVQPKVLGQAKGEIDVQYLSRAKAEKLLGWKPRHSLEQGLSKTLEWYKGYFGKK